MLVEVPGIPIRRMNGDVIYTLVDPEDFVELNTLRWSLTTNGYVQHTGKARTMTVLMGRLLLGLEKGDPLVCDHINGDKLDNRKANLRAVTQAQNAQNQCARPGTSRHRGAHLDKNIGKWRAEATVNGRRHHLGTYLTEDEAGRVAADFRRQHMPFARELAS